MGININIPAGTLREGDVLYINGRAEYVLSQAFPDKESLSEEAAKYMTRYAEVNPHLIKPFKMKKNIIKLFYDLETTGVEYKRHGVHQIAGLLEVNGEVAEEFNFHVQPHPKAVIEPEALSVCGVTFNQLQNYTPMQEVYKALTGILLKYVDKFDKTDKIHLVGFNNRHFDDDFFQMFFALCGDTFFWSYFYGDTLDVMVLASQYLIERRPYMPSFKLHRVAKELGLDVDDSKLHDGLFDVKLTREIYRIVTGLEFEI